MKCSHVLNRYSRSVGAITQWYVRGYGAHAMGLVRGMVSGVCGARGEVDDDEEEDVCDECAERRTEDALSERYCVIAVLASNLLLLGTRTVSLAAGSLNSIHLQFVMSGSDCVPMNRSASPEETVKVTSMPEAESRAGVLIRNLFVFPESNIPDHKGSIGAVSGKSKVFSSSCSRPASANSTVRSVSTMQQALAGPTFIVAVP